MRRFLYIISALLLVGLGACHNKTNEFKLVGDIDHLTDSIVTLYGMFGMPDSLIVMPVKDGKFRCTLELDTVTPMYLLFDNQKREFPVFANKGVTIKVGGDIENISSIKITGGKVQEEYNGFIRSVQGLQDKYAERELADSFIAEHPLSMVSIYLIDKYFVQVPTPNEDLINRMVERLGGYMHDHPYISSLQETAKGRIGSTSERYLPFVNLPDTTGTVLTVNDFKDKYTVVTLWASWHHESRALQDSLKRLEKKFAKHPVIFMNVSLDADKRQWLSAIRNDTLKGTHVCDFRGWGSDFVRATNSSVLPANLVLDTNRRIIARDIWGKQLEQLLNKQLDELKKVQDKKKEEERKRKNRRT